MVEQENGERNPPVCVEQPMLEKFEGKKLHLFSILEMMKLL